MRRRLLGLAASLALAMGMVGAGAVSSTASDSTWHLDQSFGDPCAPQPCEGREGEVVTSFGSPFDEIFGVALQSDGKIVAVGQVGGGANGSDFGLARYNDDGTLDTSFGTAGTGLVKTDFDGLNDGARGVAVYQDGLRKDDIVVVGEAGSESTFFNIALARYTPDGHLDTTFGPLQDGKVTTDLNTLSVGHAVAIYPEKGNTLDDKIVVGGQISTQVGKEFVVVRYNPDGSRDTESFAQGTGVKTLFPDVQYSGANSIDLDDQERIVVAGDEDPPEAGAFEFRLTTDGSLDTSFSGDGLHRDTGLLGGWGVLAAGGDIFVAGTSAGGDMGIAALGSNGQPLLGSFGQDINGSAVAVAHFQDSNANQWPSTARAVLIGRPVGTIVAVGFASLTGGESLDDQVTFAAARWSLQDGQPDTAFGDETVSTPHNGITAGFAFTYDAALSGAIQEDGDIIAAGGTNQAPSGQEQIDFGVARFTGPGSVWPGFRADVKQLPAFELNAFPASFPVKWFASLNGLETESVRFDVRTRSARWNDKLFTNWKTILQGTTKKQTDLKAVAGTTICVSVRAHADTFSTPWSSAECTATPLDDASLKASGDWNRFTGQQNYYRGTATGTGQVGAVLSKSPVWARHLALLAAKCSVCGNVDVYVDGNFVKSISLHAPKTVLQALIPIASFAKAQEHDVEIKATKQGVYIDGLGVSLA